MARLFYLVFSLFLLMFQIVEAQEKRYRLRSSGSSSILETQNRESRVVVYPDGKTYNLYQFKTRAVQTPFEEGVYIVDFEKTREVKAGESLKLNSVYLTQEIVYQLQQSIVPANDIELIRL